MFRVHDIYSSDFATQWRCKYHDLPFLESAPKGNTDLSPENNRWPYPERTSHDGFRHSPSKTGVNALMAQPILRRHLLKRSRQAKARFVDGPRVWRQLVANGRAEFLGFAVPGTAAQEAAGAARKVPSRSVGGRSFVGAIIAILDPLPHIAMHVVEDPCIGRVRADFLGPAFTLLSVRKVGLIVGDGIPEGIFSGCAGARRIFPLGFAQKPIGFAGLFREPRRIAPGFVPGYIGDGTPTLGTPRVSIFEPLAAAVGLAGVEFVKRHLELADRERLRDDDLMYRLLVGAAPVPSHHEFACRHHHHLGAIGAIAESGAGRGRAARGLWLGSSRGGGIGMRWRFGSANGAGAGLTRLTLHGRSRGNAAGQRRCEHGGKRPCGRTRGRITHGWFTPL